MSEERYLRDLARLLGALPDAERAEALDEVREHFAQGRAAGRSEADIVQHLGLPYTMATQYLNNQSPSANLPNTAAAPNFPPAPAPAFAAGSAPAFSAPASAVAPVSVAVSRPAHGVGRALAAAGLWSLNLLVVYPTLLVLALVPLSLVLSGIAIMIACLTSTLSSCVWLLTEAPAWYGRALAASILFGISGFCLGQLLLVATTGLTRALWRHVLWRYLTWSGHIMIGAK